MNASSAALVWPQATRHDDPNMAKQLRNWRTVMADPAAPECLRFFLRVARGQSLPGVLPPLFATLKRDFSGRLLAPVALKTGQRIRITDAGPFGDVGVTIDLDEAVKYLARARAGAFFRDVLDSALKRRTS